MKQHTIEGERLLSQVGGLLGNIGHIVRSCHEDWDGTGYPDGTAGNDIPLVARIVRVCDAFSAMTTDRAYRKARSAGRQSQSCAAAPAQTSILRSSRHWRKPSQAAAEFQNSQAGGLLRGLGVQVLLEPLGRKAVRLQLVRSLGEAVAFVVEHDVLDLSTQ